MYPRPDLARSGTFEPEDGLGGRGAGEVKSSAATFSGAKRWGLFASWILLFSLLFAHPLGLLARMSFSQDERSYLLFIPFISSWVFFHERHKILSDLSYDKILGRTLLLLAVCLAVVSRLAAKALSPDLQLSGYILALVLFWISGFALIFGKTACKTARFSLLFLFLSVPLPQFLLDHVIYFLQVGSAWITGALFNLSGVHALHDGLIFHLATVDIEIAKECSGIRSSLAVLIVTLLAVHFFLRSFWKKIVFLAGGVFMMIFKNGIRICSLTLLSIYVDPGFLNGRLHHQGGIVFFIAGLLLLVPLLRLLQYSEHLVETRDAARVCHLR